jgi:branched-chain amino acid transport system ATP-binding protein
MPTTRLDLDDLHVRYGRVHAVRGVSLAVAEGEIVAVLGANGAGKSSLLKAVMGLAPAAAGRILLDGVDITAWPPSARVKHKLILVPEGRRIITSLTVHENLLMGAFARRDRRHLPTVPESGGQAASAGARSFRRRAANARDRARAARRPQADDAG